jgi:hypothetical protein
MCAKNPCHKSADCTKTGPGTFKCACKEGFRGDGVLCEAIPKPPTAPAKNPQQSVIDAITKVSTLINDKLNDPMFRTSEAIQSKQDTQIADINSRLDQITKAAENLSKSSLQQSATVAALLGKNTSPSLLETNAQAEISKLKAEITQKH